MSEPLNGNRRITLTINDAIKLVVFVGAFCGYGYTQQLKYERLEARTTASEKMLAEEVARRVELEREVNEWKLATADLIFKKREVAR